MKKLLQVFILLTVSVSSALAQTSEIRGFLYDKKTGEPLMFSNVYLKNTAYGNATNGNGFYQITKVPPGEYVLTITSLGYDTIRETVTLAKNQMITKSFNLVQAATQIAEIEVFGEKINRAENVNVGVTKITPRSIKLMPSIGGEPDLAQYIQTLPGVVFTGDQGGQLYIRGGSPVQNLNLLDGMIIYNPFHSIGLFSVFDVDMIRSVDVYSGGFNADYGGRVSAVLDVKTRDGNKNKMEGIISANPFTSKLLLEGPMSKYKEGGSASSFLFSQRTSYLTRTAPVLYSFIEQKLPYSFSDTYGKMTFQSPEGSKVSFSGFNFVDRANIDSLNDIKWGNYGFGSNFMLLPEGSSTIMTGLLGYSKYDISISQESSKPRSSSVSNFNMQLDFNNYIKKNELKYGVGFMSNTTDYSTIDNYGRIDTDPAYKQNNTELFGFVRYKITNLRYVIEPSLRIHYFSSLGEMKPEPRLGAKYNLTEKVRLKFAGGWFNQNLIATRSDRDVVNLFAGYLSSPEAIDNSGGERLRTKLQTARHIITGIEIDVNENIEVDIEPYIKDFNQLINVNRNYLIDMPFVAERGWARGIDFQFNYEKNKTSVRFNYSLSKVDRTGVIDQTNIEKTYPTNFDRRHNINFIAAQKFGKDNSWEFNLRWNLGSGFPFTPTDYFYEDFTFRDGIDQDITTSNGDLGIKYVALNSGRLPHYHRLDLNVKKTIKMKNDTQLEINGGLINSYNRRNIFFVDRVTGIKTYQLPAIPSIGLSWDF